MGKRKHKVRQKFLDSLTEEEKVKRGMWGYLPTKDGKKVLCRGDMDTMVFCPFKNKRRTCRFLGFYAGRKTFG